MRGVGMGIIEFTERAVGCRTVEEMCWIVFDCCHTE